MTFLPDQDTPDDLAYSLQALHHDHTKITPAGVVTTVAAGTNARFGGPGGIPLDNSDNIYVADANNHTVRKMVLSAQP